MGSTKEALDNLSSQLYEAGLFRDHDAIAQAIQELIAANISEALAALKGDQR